MDREYLLSGQAAASFEFQQVALLDPDWDTVFQIGAGQAGAAAATAFAGPEAAVLGDAIGKALWRTIAGSAPDPEAEFKREVLEHLESIEKKLDQILAFFKNDLAQITRQSSEQSQASNAKNQLEAARTTCNSYIAVLAKHKLSEDEFGLALTAAQKVFEIGITLMHYGQEYYTAVIHSYVSGIALYGRLAKIRPKWTAALRTFSADYRRYAENCLGDAVPPGYWSYPEPTETLKMADKRIGEEGQWSQRVLDRVSKGRVYWLFATNSPTVAHGGFFEFVDSGKGFNGNYQFAYMWDNPPPSNRQELIQRVTSSPYNWEIPSFREVFEVADSPRRDGYAETLAQLWSALSMQQRNLTVGPQVKQALASLEHLRASATTMTSLKDSS